ncbi:hypothetical protein EJ110_NYTH19432 [Nymphaea thermarum]|nr:hypothetical protein EJ110_NYTH19432 [Nymphaea thermarum]
MAAWGRRRRRKAAEMEEKEKERKTMALVARGQGCDNTSSIQNSRDIPGKALVHAITPASSKATTLIVTPSSDISLDDAAYYYIFYFSEVSQAAYQNKSRSFDFLVDGIKRNDDPIIPPYGTYVTDYNHGRNLTAGSVISLANTANASLPPILNAMELFKLKTGLADGTSENDAKSMEELQGQYQQLQSWAGDPCLPAVSIWDWLKCHADNPPRVTERDRVGGVNGSISTALVVAGDPCLPAGSLGIGSTEMLTIHEA